MAIIEIGSIENCAYCAHCNEEVRVYPCLLTDKISWWCSVCHRATAWSVPGRRPSPAMKISVR
jgi:hypothetical protein